MRNVYRRLVTDVQDVKSVLLACVRYLVNDCCNEAYRMDLRWSSIAQDNLILSIKVSTPVTDLNRTFKIENFQHRLVMTIMHRNRLLVLVDEIIQSTRWNVVVRSIYHRCTRLGDKLFVSESLDVLGCCVRNYIRRAGSSMIKGG